MHLFFYKQSLLLDVWCIRVFRQPVFVGRQLNSQPPVCCPSLFLQGPTTATQVAKIKLDRSQAKDLLPAKAYYKGVIKSSDALADPAGQAALVAPPRPQVWEARKLLGQFSSGKQVRCNAGKQ
jgi:hypothetical protein